MSQNLQEPIHPDAKPHNDGGDSGIGGGEGILCTDCGTVNSTEARFCTKCGQSLEPIEQISTMQIREGSSFSAYDAPVGRNVEASTTPLPLSPDTEEAAPITGKQEAMSSIPPVSSPNKGGAIPIIRNWLGGNNHDGWRRRTRSRRFITIALIVLILLLVGSSLPFLVPYLHTILPASSATVTITPAGKNFSKTYAISAVTGTPDASQHQVQARLLSFTTKAQSQTVKATGQGHQYKTGATGKVTISPRTGTVPAGNVRVPSNSGVNVIVSVSNPISSGGQTFDASAEQGGSGGNIPAYDINATYYLQSDPNVTFYAQNTSPFTGGQDASDYTFVQQSDIDDAANPLQTQLTSDAQTAVQNQVRANEQLVSDIQCNPKIASNHQANDRATDVTVTVSVTCQGEVYDLQAAQSMAVDLLQSDAAAQLGDSYTLVGNVVTGVPIIVTTDQGGTVLMNADAQGVWVFQLSDAQKQSLAQAIAGKTQADASALLLKQQGVSKVSITTSGGWGTALPAPDNIKMVVLSVPGLDSLSTTQTPQPTSTLNTPETIPVGPHPTIVLKGDTGAVSVHSTGANNFVTIQVPQQPGSSIPYQRSGNGNNIITL
jgi:hypothetical protein